MMAINNIVDESFIIRIYEWDSIILIFASHYWSSSVQNLILIPFELNYTKEKKRKHNLPCRSRVLRKKSWVLQHKCNMYPLLSSNQADTWRQGSIDYSSDMEDSSLRVVRFGHFDPWSDQRLQEFHCSPNNCDERQWEFSRHPYWKIKKVIR